MADQPETFSKADYEIYLRVCRVLGKAGGGKARGPRKRRSAEHMARISALGVKARMKKKRQALLSALTSEESDIY